MDPKKSQLVKTIWLMECFDGFGGLWSMDQKFKPWQQKGSKQWKVEFCGTSLSRKMRFHKSGLNTTFGFIFTKWLGHLLSADQPIFHLLIDTCLQERKLHTDSFSQENRFWETAFVKPCHHNSPLRYPLDPSNIKELQVLSYWSAFVYCNKPSPKTLKWSFTFL